MPWGFGKQDQGEGPRLAQEPPELSNLRATEPQKQKLINLGVEVTPIVFVRVP